MDIYEYNPTIDRDMIDIRSNEIITDRVKQRLYKYYPEMFDKIGDMDLGFDEDLSYKLYLCFRKACNMIILRTRSDIDRVGIFKDLFRSSNLALRIECSDSHVEDVTLFRGRVKLYCDCLYSVADNILKIIQYNQEYKHITAVVIELGYLYICEPIDRLGWSGNIGYGRYCYGSGKCFMDFKYPREVPGMYCLGDFFNQDLRNLSGEIFSKKVRTMEDWKDFRNSDFEKYLKQVSEVIIIYLKSDGMMEKHGYNYMLISRGKDVIITDDITNMFSKKKPFRWSMKKDGMRGLEGKFLNTFSSLIAHNDFPEVHSIRFDCSLTRKTGKICYYYRNSYERGAVDIKITRK